MGCGERSRVGARVGGGRVHDNIKRCSRGDSGGERTISKMMGWGETI